MTLFRRVIQILIALLVLPSLAAVGAGLAQGLGVVVLLAAKFLGLVEEPNVAIGWPIAGAVAGVALAIAKVAKSPVWRPAEQTSN